MKYYFFDQLQHVHLIFLIQNSMKKLLFMLITGLAACTSKPKTTSIYIALTGSHTLKIAGLDYTIVRILSKDTSTSGWQSLISVYRMPADTDMKDYQKPQPGKYLVTDSTVFFSPDTPFLKHQTYFVRCYHYERGGSLWGNIKQHKKLGSHRFTDLIFKQ